MSVELVKNCTPPKQPRPRLCRLSLSYPSAARARGERTVASAPVQASLSLTSTARARGEPTLSLTHRLHRANSRIRVRADYPLSHLLHAHAESEQSRPHPCKASLSLTDRLHVHAGSKQSRPRPCRLPSSHTHRLHTHVESEQSHPRPCRLLPPLSLSQRRGRAASAETLGASAGVGLRVRYLAHQPRAGVRSAYLGLTF